MIRLTDKPFDPGPELSAFCGGRSKTGAVASFVGIARGDASAPCALELEAYPGFTEGEEPDVEPVSNQSPESAGSPDRDDHRCGHAALLP